MALSRQHHLTYQLSQTREAITAHYSSSATPTVAHSIPTDSVTGLVQTYSSKDVLGRWKHSNLSQAIPSTMVMGEAITLSRPIPISALSRQHHLTYQLSQTREAITAHYPHRPHLLSAHSIRQTLLQAWSRNTDLRMCWGQA